MKKIFVIAAMAVVALAFQSCENASSLAKKLIGGWSGAPERLFDAGASSATVIETFSFAPADTIKNGGQLTITALISVTGAMNGAEGIIQPVSLTASGYATLTGTWKAISADRIEVTLDPEAMTVNVDPSAVVINANAATGTAAAPDVDNLRPQLAQSISAQMRKAVEARYADVETLNGVSLKDNTLKFKINKTAYTLTRQAE